MSNIIFILAALYVVLNAFSIMGVKDRLTKVENEIKIQKNLK